MSADMVCEKPSEAKKPKAIIELDYYSDFVILNRSGISAKVSLDREGKLTADITRHIEK